MAQRYEITDAVFKTLQVGAAANLLQVGAGASAQVKDLQGNNLTVYQAETGGSTFSNPLTTDSSGRIEGWVESPDFDIAISGTGIGSYTQKVRQSPAGSFNVKSYGAKGDGSTDDTAAIQAAITAARAANGTVFAPAGTYKITGTLTGSETTAFRFMGAGPGLTVLSHQMDLPMFSFLGSLATNKALTNTPAVGSTTMTFASTSGLAADDFIVIRDSSQPIYGDSGKTAEAATGEIRRVKTVDSGTQITTRGRLENAYTTNTLVAKLNAVDGIWLSDVTIVNSAPGTHLTTARGLIATYAKNIRIKDVEFKDFDGSQIHLQTCVDFQIQHPKFLNARDLEQATNPYCIIATNGTCHGVVIGAVGRYGRHLFTTGAISTEPPAQHIRLVGCIATEFTQAAFDTHPGSRFITFDSCEAHGCTAQGFQIRGPDSAVINPVVSQATKGVSAIYGADRFLLRGGRLYGCDTGIEIDSSTDAMVKDVWVQSPVTNGLLVQESNAPWAGYVTGLTIDDVTVTGTPATAAFNFSVWNDAFQIGRIYAPSATTKTTGNVNVPTVYGLYNDGFPGVMAPTAPDTLKGSLTLTANQAQVARFVPQRNMTINTLSFAVTTAAGSDDAVDVGIYGPNSSAGVLTRLVSKGATTGLLNSTGVKTVSITATKLVAGTVYYVALSCGTIGTTAATIASNGMNSTIVNALMGSGVPLMIVGSKATSHPLPSTISGPSNATQGPNMGVLE